MNRYHLFFDTDNRAVVIEDHPKALDEAPYDRIVRRHGPVDPAAADLALQKHGGIAIFADAPAREFAGTATRQSPECQMRRLGPKATRPLSPG